MYPQQEIRALGASGNGVLFATHDPKPRNARRRRAFLLRQRARIADGDVRTVLNRAQLEALYGAKLAIFQDRDSGESAFLPG